MTKQEIIEASDKTFFLLTDYCSSISDADFYKSLEGKWSVAENIDHLILSTNTTSLAYWLPKFIVRLLAGKPNRTSRTFEELQTKYYNKLADGGRASSRFVPKPKEITYVKQKLLNNWTTSTTKYLQALKKNRSEDDLDAYLVKHPLLGRITLRELCYFTIFHTQHHLNSIKKIA